MTQYLLMEDITGRLVKAEVIEVASGNCCQTFFRVPEEAYALTGDALDRKGYKRVGIEVN